MEVLGDLQAEEHEPVESDSKLVALVSNLPRDGLKTTYHGASCA